MDARIARLKAFVAAQRDAGKIQRDVAAGLGIAQGALSRVLNERDDVTRDLAFAIERATSDWSGGQILATEWGGYKPRLGRRAPLDVKPESSDSGTHSATDPDASEKLDAAGCT